MSFTPNPLCASYRKLPCTLTDTRERTTDIVANVNHSVNHDYSVTVGGTTIPILKTVRMFNIISIHEVARTFPASGWGIQADIGIQGGVIACTEPEYDKRTATVTEDCVIEKSTLAYIDHRRGVVLYRYEKQWVKFNIVTTDVCDWRTMFGSVWTNKVVIRRDDVDSGKIMEWRLVVNGVQKVLTSETDTAWHPFGEGVSAQRVDGKMTDPEIFEILSIPQPPSEAMPYDYDIKAIGFYDYGNAPGDESELNIADGGNKDYFYPEWCRGLHQDPIWREIADNRYFISWYKSEAVANKQWLPPALPTDPLPRGNHAYHPQIEDVWQWLCPTLYSGNIVKSSHDFNELIDKQLVLAKNTDGTSKNLKTHNTTLYFPIGVT